MFERFTDYARRVVLASQDEARALGQDEVRPEHLLLALTVERDAAAAAALESHGAWHDALVEAVVAAGGRASGPSSIPETDTVPFGRAVKRLLEVALRESLQLGQDHVGTEHVLLAVLQQGGTATTDVLAAVGTDPAAVRSTLIATLSEGERAAGVAAPPVCPRCGRGIEGSLSARTIAVDGSEAGSARILYCGECGVTLGAHLD